MEWMFGFRVTCYSNPRQSTVSTVVPNAERLNSNPTFENCNLNVCRRVTRGSNVANNADNSLTGGAIRTKGIRVTCKGPIGTSSPEGRYSASVAAELTSAHSSRKCQILMRFGKKAIHKTWREYPLRVVAEKRINQTCFAEKEISHLFKPKLVVMSITGNGGVGILEKRWEGARFFAV